jgi:hypothetical protein
MRKTLHSYTYSVSVSFFFSNGVCNSCGRPGGLTLCPGIFTFESIPQISLKLMRVTRPILYCRVARLLYSKAEAYKV